MAILISAATIAIAGLIVVWALIRIDRERKEETRRRQEEREAQEAREEVARSRAAIWAMNGGRSRHTITRN